MTSVACQLPPPLSEDDFDAFLADATLTPIRTHLDACPYCRGRFERHRGFSKRLVTIVRRGDCPTPDVLLDYQDHVLSSIRQAAVAAHLGYCQRCTEELATIATFATEMAEEVHLAETLAYASDLKAAPQATNGQPPRQLFDFSALFTPLTTLFPVLRPAVGGLKGGGADEAIQRLTAATDRVTVTLSTYPTTEGQVRARAMVLTVEDAESDDDDAPLRWAGALWDMWRDRHPVASTLLDRDAEGEIPALASGDYTLHITAPFGERLVLSGIRIEGRGTAGAR